MTPGDAGHDPGDRTKKLMEVWIDSDSKIHLIVFYRDNPGVIETCPGLARRLAIPVQSLEEAVRDHIELGVLQERTLGDRTLLVYDPERDRELQASVEAEALRQLQESEAATGQEPPREEGP